MKMFILASIFLIFLPNDLIALEELEPVQGLDTIPGPDIRNVGWEWHYIDQDGKPGHMRKINGDDRHASYIRSDGCTWTRATSGFAPATTWSNCPSSGSSDVKILDDSLWPLQLGNRIDYQVSGTSSGV